MKQNTTFIISIKDIFNYIRLTLPHIGVTDINDINNIATKLISELSFMLFTNNVSFSDKMQEINQYMINLGYDRIYAREICDVSHKLLLEKIVEYAPDIHYIPVMKYEIKILNKDHLILNLR